MNDVKHITIINQYIGSPYHGMEYRHYFLAKNLMEFGYKVTLVSGSYSHLHTTSPKVKKTFTKEIIDGIEYIWVKTPKYKSSKSIGRIWNMLCFSWKLNFLRTLPPSHILVSSPSLFPVKVGKKLAVKFQTKFLFEVRDIWPLTLVELSSLSYKNPIIKLMQYYEAFAYKNADYVVSLLPTAKEYFEEKGMQSDKFVYLPNGIEVKGNGNESFSPDFMSKIPKNKFIVAYSGTVGIANNLDYLIEVADFLKKNSDIHFIILGQGGEKKRLQERVKILKLDNFTFLNPVSKEEVGAFLELIDVAFISLLPEQLFRFGVSPNKVFDYMYAKKPILWTIEAGNNLVEEASCGYTIALDDVEALGQAILELSQLEPIKLMELGKNGYNFVTKYHSYRMLAERLIKIVGER